MILRTSSKKCLKITEKKSEKVEALHSDFLRHSLIVPLYRKAMFDVL
jgi:hypothetical protein